MKTEEPTKVKELSMFKKFNHRYKINPEKKIKLENVTKELSICRKLSYLYLCSPTS